MKYNYRNSVNFEKFVKYSDAARNHRQGIGTRKLFVTWGLLRTVVSTYKPVATPDNIFDKSL